MLDAIGDADNVEKWLTNALDHGERLMGFGHRVYKAEDPRAEILREMARDGQRSGVLRALAVDRGARR